MGAVEGQWTYNVENGGATITASTATGAVTIPNELGGYAVKKVGNNWPPIFGDPNTSVTSVVIPDSVTSIGLQAFYNCTSLASISVDSANINFSSAEGVLFNKNKTTLVQYPPSKTGNTYTIPASVTSIGNYAFQSCTNLDSVTIGNSVTSIGNSAFSGCTSLTSVTIGNSVTSIGRSAFADCTNLTSVTIGNSVTSIGNSAFSNCTNLASITIPDSVTSIGDYAFAHCTSLTSITIPASVTSIGERAFQGCAKLPQEVLKQIKAKQ